MMITSRAMVFTLMALILFAQPAATSGRAAVVYSDNTLTQAVALLDAAPSVPIRLVDFTDRTQVRPADELAAEILRRASGVVQGDRTQVLMNSASMWYQRARAGDSFALHVFASEVAHELAHIAGAGERDAYARQIEVFGAFIASGAVDRGIGERYVVALRRQRAREVS